MNKISACLILLFPSLFIEAASVENLRCEYLVDPMGVDAPTPRLSGKREEDKFTLNVTNPANTIVTIYVPRKSASDISESGKPVSRVTGVEFSGMKNGKARFNCGSGNYSFQTNM